ncbi:hypothetical protein VTL71DRAFT_7664 [Oculimacula yallundae]|uniref:Acetyl-CoA synthetase-like protein n=1 Tax=Oculimacula yallundae TaxID=86028 RepID=A0ABR4BUV0_9HELO
MSKPEKALSFARGEDLQSPAEHLHDLLKNAAINNKSKIAVVCLHQPSSFLSSITQSTQGDCLRWTFEELLRASHAFAQSLAAAGVRPGMRIAAFIYNVAEYHIILRASLELNCVFTPLNPKTLMHANEAKHVLELLDPSVLITPDAESARKLTSAASDLASNALVKLHYEDSSERLDGWLGFEDFTEGWDGKDRITDLQIHRDLDDVCMVLMTSGTTSMPKGCPHTSRSYVTSIRAQVTATALDQDRSSCCHVSTFHLAGSNFSIMYHAQGLKVVYPGPTFSPQASLKAFRQEKCTDLPGIPAMVVAMTSHPDFQKSMTSSVKLAIVGGTTVLPEHYRMVSEEMGARRVCGSYAMTEHGVSLLHRYDDEPIYDRNTDGRPTPGYMVRVCKAESKEVVTRGTRGEFHIGGPGVVESYWLHPLDKNKQYNDVFYDDDEGHWLMTGDEGVMEDDDQCIVTGRYKDLIIRGGKNISPSSIEVVLSSRFNITAEVVAFPDEVAGEVPVALVRKKSGDKIDFMEVKETLLKELGPSFVLESILDIRSLGLAEFPRTLTGKVKKNELREMLKSYRKQESSTSVVSGQDTESLLLSVWTGVLGIRPGTLTAKSSIADWADSLIFSRFAAVLYREAGLSISLQELMVNETVEKQARLLSSQKGSSTKNANLQSNRQGPPSANDMVHANGNLEVESKTKNLCIEVLKPLGLSWDHVEDVTPIHSYFQRILIAQRLQSNNHRHAWLCPGISVERLQHALKTTLGHHSILRTMAIDLYDTPFHVTVRPSQRWFSHVITTDDIVKSADDLRTLALNDPKRDFAVYPGPMFKATIAHVEQENCAGLVYMVQHSVFDGVHWSLFLDDLHSVLETPGTTLAPHVPYKFWADLYFTHQDSLAARQLVDWHVERLSTIGLHSASLFPFQRSPGWYKGDTKSGWRLKRDHTKWIDLSTTEEGPERMSLDGSTAGVEGISRTAHLPDLEKLRKDHDIKEYTFLKAALAIMNTFYTKTDTALFCQAQAGRTWPFLPKWMQARLPPAMDIAGPAIHVIVNCIKISAEETVQSLLTRLQAEQTKITAHELAPYFSIIEKLGKENGKIMDEVASRQGFNWLPAITQDYKHLKKKQVLSRTDIGLLWNCTMVDRNTVCVMPSWDDAQLRLKEVEEILSVYLKIATMLATKENWEKKVGELDVGEMELMYAP